MRLIRSIATVGGYTGLSRLFGLAREILMSHSMGATALTDAFLIAFKFPNFFRRFFAEGAFNAAFVPVFSATLAQEGRDSAKKIAEEVFVVLLVTLLILVASVTIFAPSIIHILAPGFATTPERLEMATLFIRITFPYILFISLSALFAGILNSLDRFAAAAAAPILLNIMMIAGLLSYHILDLGPGMALSIAVFFAGVIQFGWMMWACRRAGVVLKWKIPRFTAPVKNVLKLMVPGAIGAGVMNINILIDMILASYLPEGSISFLHYADRLNQLPLSLFGIAIGTALLPSLSREIRIGALDKASRNQNIAIELGLQLTLPASIGLIILSHPIISLIYGFDETGTVATAQALAAFALGIPAYVLGKIFSTAYFARQDTVTPVKIAIFSIGCNLILNLILMRYLAHVGLALSTALSAWINSALLLWTMRRKKYYQRPDNLPKSLLKTVSACVGMGVLLYGSLNIFYTSHFWGKMMALTGQISIGLGAFLFLGHFFKAFDLTRLRNAFKRE